MPNDKLDVTVLLPCYNEEKALPQVIQNIRAALEGRQYSYEILVVDDGSSDHSANLAEQLGCRVIRRPFKGGAGASRKTGIIAAEGAIIVMLDADGTYTAADIPRMLEFFPAFDQVNGARTQEKGNLRVLRASVKWCIRMFASLLACYQIPDLNTGLKAFKRGVMMQYLWTVSDGFSCVTAMTLSFLCNGHPVKYISTQYHERIGCSKFHPIKDTYYYIFNICRLILYFKPLRICVPLGGLLGIGGFIGLLYNVPLGLLMMLSGIVVIALSKYWSDRVMAKAKARWQESQKMIYG